MISTLLGILLNMQPFGAAPVSPQWMAMATAADHLRAGQFETAADQYDLLAAQTTSVRLAFQYETISRLIRETGGVYVVTDPYPSESFLLGINPIVPMGPALLSDPNVLQAALRDEARLLVYEALGYIDQGRERMSVDVALATHYVSEARRTLDRADALFPSASVGYRAELARLGLDAYRARAHEHAESFDSEIAALPSDPIGASVRMKRIGHLLSAVEQNLALAVEFGRQDEGSLADELASTVRDLAALRQLRRTLLAEDVQ